MLYLPKKFSRVTEGFCPEADDKKMTVFYGIIFIVLIASLTVFIFKKLKKIVVSKKDLDFILLEIRVPKVIDERFEAHTAPLAAEHMFASLHGLLKEDQNLQEHFSFEFIARDGSIRFYVAVPEKIADFIESQVYGQYPTAHIVRVDDYAPEQFKTGQHRVATLSFRREDHFPLKSFRDFEIDSLSGITSALAEAENSEDLWFQMVMKPLPDVWQEEGYKYVESVREGGNSSSSNVIDFFSGVLQEFSKIVGSVFSGLLSSFTSEESDGDKFYSKDSKKFLTSSEDLEVKSIEDKLSKMGFEVVIRILSHADSGEKAESLLRSLAASMNQFSTSHLNGLVSQADSDSEAGFYEYKNRTLDSSKSIVLNIEELASIYHLPSSLVETPGVSWIGSKKAEPPQNLPTEGSTYLAETLFRDKKVTFGIKDDGEDRVRHMYLIGKTGTGKSTFFKNMIVQDIINGHGVGVVDPHGDLIEDVLEYIPEHRMDDVVIVDPSDVEKPVGINVLELEDESQKNLMASALVSSMKKQFDYSWGPRLEYLLNYSVLTLLEVPGTSMLGITRLLNDMNYQKYILKQISDPVVLDFWEEEYKAMRGNQRLITEAVAPIQNKINRFLSSTTIRNILGQKKSTVDFWDIMNTKKILLLNLSKGKIGADNANLLGALLVSRIQFMAMQRIKIPSQERLPFYLYVDEFQNFAGGSFESILSESRKYKLGLHLTHQFTNQLSEELLAAVFGNVGTIASFAVGAQDAKVLETEFAPYFDENDLISLEKFQIYMKLMIDGQTSKPFSATVPRPWVPEETLIHKTSNKDEVIRRSREKYGTDREYVEGKIRKWVEHSFGDGPRSGGDSRGGGKGGKMKSSGTGRPFVKKETNAKHG